MLARVNVENGPQSGQEWRASNNFDMFPPKGTSTLTFKVTTGNAPQLRFALAADVQWAADDILHQNIADGVAQAVLSGHAFPTGYTDVYFGGVTGGTSKFTVEVWAD